MNKVINLRNVSKEFVVRHDRKRTLFERLFNKNNEKKDILKALDNINLNVNEGDVIGVIGPNGSGKSTLLKVIAGIMEPNKGSVWTNGRIVSFISLGVGFHPDLTARENVFLYGAIMGLSEKYLNEKFEEIISFAELERFEDTKLRNFSSGMQVRLAFSTAIQTNPEILLIDEVFAVGDMSFKEKSLKELNKFKKEGKTIVFVSHSLDQVESFCDRAVFLKEGRIVKKGSPKKVIKTYKKSN